MESSDTVICPQCDGVGTLDGGNCAPRYTCDLCNGTGRIPTPKESK